MSLPGAYILQTSECIPCSFLAMQAELVEELELELLVPSECTYTRGKLAFGSERNHPCIETPVPAAELDARVSATVSLRVCAMLQDKPHFIV